MSSIDINELMGSIKLVGVFKKSLDIDSAREVFFKKIVSITNEYEARLKQVTDDYNKIHMLVVSKNKIIEDCKGAISTKEKTISELENRIKYYEDEMEALVKDHKAVLKSKDTSVNVRSRKTVTVTANAMLKMDKKTTKALELKDKEIVELKARLSKLSTSSNPTGTKIFTCEDVKTIRKQSSNGKNIKVLATIYKCSPDTIRRIVNKQTYKKC